MAVTYAETEAAQFDAMAEMRDKHKVQVKRWDDKTLAAFEKAGSKCSRKKSAKDATFKKVADHYLDFRKIRHLGRRAGDEADLPKPAAVGRGEEVRPRRRRRPRRAPARRFSQPGMR